MGGSLGVVLPGDVLNRLRLGRGDTVFLTEIAGGYHMTPFDPNLKTEMKPDATSGKKQPSGASDPTS